MTVAVEEAFVVTVGVPHNARDAHCRRVLKVLEQAGYQAGPTSGDSILELARQEQAVRELAANDDQENI